MRTYYLIVGLLLASQILLAQPASVNLLRANGTVVSTHASITEAYAAILTPVNQAYTIELQNTYLGTSETVPLVLSVKTGVSATQTITIRPAANFSTITLSAPVAMGHLIELNDADFLILDGRPGGVGTSSAITLNNTATNGNTIALTNGACNNIIRYLQLANSGTVSTSRTLAILASTSNPSGNSDNRFEYNVSIGSVSGFNSNGSSANPNRNNVFYGNDIQSAKFSGIHMQAGTGRVLIDSNKITGTLTPSNTFNFGILFDSQTDTAIVRNNLIFDVYTSNEAASRGISVRSTAMTGTDNYTEIYNNFISMNQLAPNSTSVVGIEYGGVYPVHAKVMFNTVVIGGTLNSGGIAEQVLSAAFSRTASNASSSYYLRNNIFINTRSGGVSGGQHVVVSFANISGSINTDFNTYNTPGTLARFGTATYSTLPAYAFAVGGANEANSNLTPVQLIGATNLRLTGPSLGNPNLGGTAITGITRDHFNTTRSNVPYRGAHEASPSLGTQCQGAPTAGDLTQSDTSFCPGAPPVRLRLTQAATGGGIVYEWQESLNNNNFTSINGATSDSLLVNPGSTRWYRVVTRCVPSGLTAYSDTVRLVRNALPVIGALSFSRAGAAYTFNLNNSAQVDSFLWNFGDGSPDVVTSSASASHTYTVNGAYPVRVKAFNSCGVDSVQLNLNVTAVSLNELFFQNLKLFPNPAVDRVYVHGIAGAFTVVLRDLQGRVLAKYDAEGDFNFSVVDLKAGLYLLEISNNTGKQRTYRLIKD